MSHVVRMCPYSKIQMSQVVKCVRHANDRTNDHTNESLPIINVPPMQRSLESLLNRNSTRHR